MRPWRRSSPTPEPRRSGRRSGCAASWPRSRPSSRSWPSTDSALVRRRRGLRASAWLDVRPMDALTTRWRPPLIWRALMLLARLATSLVCRLRVTGEVAPALRQGPLVGWLLRRCGHIRVDRRLPTVGHALPAATQALLDGSVVAAYPEGRISLDPGVWPERGKTGVARLALTTGTPVVPVSQWGAHEVLAWDGTGAMAR